MLEIGHPSEALYHHPHCPETQVPLPVPADAYPAIDQPDWLPPVLSTVAIHGTGVDDLMQAIRDHADYLRETGEWRRRDRDRLQADLSARIQAGLIQRWRNNLPENQFVDIFRKLENRQISPEEAAQFLIDHQPSSAE
jgi:LAO/AO transport system kinase